MLRQYGSDDKVRAGASTGGGVLDGIKPTRREPDRLIADVTLLLEGTYPFVRGGVSSWVHQIISGLPEVTFSLAFIGGARDHYEEQQYELPANVVHFESHFIMESSAVVPPRRRRGDATSFQKLPDLLKAFRLRESGFEESALESIVDRLGTKEGILEGDFLFSEPSWNFVRDCYYKYCTDPSFIDYFWTVRTIHRPLFRLAEIARSLPVTGAYHAISTGYAGFLGTLLKRRTNRAFVLTEHGIYTKERKIDLGQAEWIKDPTEAFGGGLHSGVGHLRELWIRFFEGVGRLTYNAAEPIIALYRGNSRRQVDDGVPLERTKIIPNGVEVARFSKLRAPPQQIPPVVGLIGRVVPIKDMKTFIQAIRSVCTEIPEAEGWVIGPEDEDAEYARECRDLVSNLGLEGKVKFLGFQKVDHILPRLGLNALTSISEALPLVVLEGFAAGLPAVTTDVGSCRELIDGGSKADAALGSAGAVVPIADPEAFAAAAVNLLTDPNRWRAAQRSGIDRVERFYTMPMMIDSYREIYDDALLTKPETAWQGSGSSSAS